MSGNIEIATCILLGFAILLCIGKYDSKATNH